MITRDLIASFFGKFANTDSSEIDITTSTLSTKIVSDNPRRIGLVVTNNSPVPITITRVGPASATQEMVIGMQETREFWWYNELAEVTRAFFINNANLNGTVHVREVVLVGSDDS